MFGQNIFMYSPKNALMRLIIFFCKSIIKMFHCLLNINENNNAITYSGFEIYFNLAGQIFRF